MATRLRWRRSRDERECVLDQRGQNCLALVSPIAYWPEPVTSYELKFLWCEWMAELPPFCCPIPNGFSPYDWFGFALCPPPLQVALGLLIYIDAGTSIYNCDDASAAAVGPACPGGLAHLHRLMSAPGFGMAVPTAGQCMCMATISRLSRLPPAYAFKLAQDWPCCSGLSL